MSVGLAHQLEHAFNRNSWSAAEVNRLSEGSFLALVREVLLGNIDIQLIIDCDADPFVPDGWKVEEHQKGGSFKWDPAQTLLHFFRSRRGGKVITGNEIREELAGKPVLNANVLDFLLKYPDLIPDEWKAWGPGCLSIFFWGTIYSGSRGYPIVRCLYFDNAWRDGFKRISEEEWIGLNPWKGLSDPVALRILPSAEVQAV